MSAAFHLTESEKGKFWFNLVAGNGEKILTSQMYVTYAGAENGVESVKKNAASVENFEKLVAENGKPYFVLHAANGQIVGKSQMYSSDAACDGGITAVMNAAPGAEIIDKTGK